MATAGFAAAPGLSTAEEDSTSTVHQTITCHYHVYAPTTVHVSSGEPRCVIESSSESATECTTPRSPLAQGPIQTDGASLKESKLKIDETLHARKAEGNREAILRWLITELTVLLEKASRREQCVVTVCQGRA